MRRRWRFLGPHPDVVILIMLFLALLGVLRIIYRPRLVRNSPYLLCIVFDEQIPPFRDHMFAISKSGKIEWLQ